jgi:hypothetical protein
MTHEWPEEMATEMRRTAEFSKQLVGLPFAEALRLGGEAGFVVQRWTRIQSADLVLSRIVARVDENDVVTGAGVG